MRLKLADLTQRIANAAHLGGLKPSEQAAQLPSADNPSPVPTSNFHWTPSFLGSEKSTPELATSVWQLAKQARLATHNADLAKLPLADHAAALIGREIWAARQIAPGKSMQIVSGAKLIAVLSTASPVVSVRSDVLREDLEFMTALVRPESASGTPVGFINHDLWNMLWQYGVYDASALLELPAEVAWRPLQLRRLPQVAPYLLRPRHASILRHLLDADQSFEQLVTLTGQDSQELCQDIAAMMLTRSVKSV